MDEQAKRSVHAIQGFDPSVLFDKGFNLGCADLIQGGSFREAVGRTVAFLLIHTVDRERRPVFRGATVVLPPAAATVISEDSVLSALMKATQDVRGFEVDEERGSGSETARAGGELPITRSRGPTSHRPGAG